MIRYPTTGSGDEAVAHRYRSIPEWPYETIWETQCGERLSPAEPWEVYGDDGSVLWCCTCFPDAAPPGPFR